MTDLASKKGWGTYRFDQIATMVNDRVDDPSQAGVEYYVGLEHLDSDSLAIRRWGSPTDVEATKLRFRAGDIIFGRRRVYQRKLGVAHFDGICSAHAMVLRAKPSVVLPEFLPFFMQSDLFMERAQQISVGSLSPTINWKTLAKEEFDLPPLEEQRRIATIAVAAGETVEQLRECVRRASALLNAIRDAAFDPARYRTTTLGQLCNEGRGIQIGPFGAQLHQSEYCADGVPVIMPSDMEGNRVSVDSIARVSEEKADSLAVHRVLDGDILLPRRGDLTKRACIGFRESGWICGTGSIRVRLQAPVAPQAVLHAMASRHVVRWIAANAVGSTMPNLNTKIVRRIPIALPSELRLQEVMRVLGEVEDGFDALSLRAETAERLRQKTLAAILSQ